MPIYEYQCDDCGDSFEVFQKMSDDPLDECEKCGGPLRKVLHPVAIHFKGSGFYTTDYGKGSRQAHRGSRRAGPARLRRAPLESVPGDGDVRQGRGRRHRRPATASPRRRRRRPDAPGGELRGATDATRPCARRRPPCAGWSATVRRTFRPSISSPTPSGSSSRSPARSPSSTSASTATAASSRSSAGASSAEILDAVAANLEGMVGSTLRRLDVVSDFTLTDDAFIVLLSPPRSAAVIADDDLAAVTRRVYERLQSLLLNDLAPGRVRPRAPVRRARPSSPPTTRSPSSRTCSTASRWPCRRRRSRPRSTTGELETTLADCVDQGELEPLFEPVVDPVAREVIGYRSSVRGPFYSPLRLPDVLLDVARRSQVLASYGVVAREATVSAAAGPASRTTCSSSAAPPASCPTPPSSPSASSTRSTRRWCRSTSCSRSTPTTSPTNTASTLRTLADVRDLGFLLCISGLGAQFTALELIAEAHPDFLCLDPVLVAGLDGELTPIEVVQLLVRFAGRAGAQLIATGRARRGAAAACWRATGSSCSAARRSRAPTRGCRR